MSGSPGSRNQSHKHLLNVGKSCCPLAPAMALWFGRTLPHCGWHLAHAANVSQGSGGQGATSLPTPMILVKGQDVSVSKYIAMLLFPRKHVSNKSILYPKH